MLRYAQCGRDEQDPAYRSSLGFLILAERKKAAPFQGRPLTLSCLPKFDFNASRTGVFR